MRSVGYVARVVELRNSFKILVEKLKGKKHLDDVSVDGKI
jgi:hypothetical protein